MTGKPDFRKPVPQGVVEHIGLGAGSSSAMMELDGGSLLLIEGSNGRLSSDGGQNWDGPWPLNCEAMGSPSNLACIRLQSGVLALVHRGAEQAGRGTEEFHLNPFYTCSFLPLSVLLFTVGASFPLIINIYTCVKARFLRDNLV